jgi:hypothetical protein
MPPVSTTPDRRSEARKQGSSAIVGRLVSHVPADCVDARIRNICATGVGLLIDRDVEIEKVEAVILFGQSPTMSLRIPIEAVYCIDSRDGRHFLLGARFTRRLESEEIRQLSA